MSRSPGLQSFIEEIIARESAPVGVALGRAGPHAGEGLGYLGRALREAGASVGGGISPLPAALEYAERAYGDTEAGVEFRRALMKSFLDMDSPPIEDVRLSSDLMKAIAGTSGSVGGSVPWLGLGALVSALGLSNVTGGGAISPLMRRAVIGAGTPVIADVAQKVFTGRETGASGEYFGDLSEKGLTGAAIVSGLGGVPGVGKFSNILDDIALAVLANKGSSNE